MKIMETPKQKAIREAYGECWEQVKDFVDQNGWFDYDFYDQNKSLKYKTAFDLVSDKINTLPNSAHTHIRPKTIEGIDMNNGWLSVKEHGLPKEDAGYYHICVQGKQEEGVYFWVKNTAIFTCNSFAKYASASIVTHYQPIAKPKPPIY